MKLKLSLFLFFLLFMGSQAYGGSVQEFSFKSLDGKTFTSAELKGAPLVVNIGSHW